MEGSVVTRKGLRATPAVLSGMPEISGIPSHVLATFEHLTLDLIQDGWRHYSADALLHRIRWHYQIERDQRDFKCNNNWTAQMARAFHKMYPQHAGFFRTRRSPGTIPPDMFPEEMTLYEPPI